MSSVDPARPSIRISNTLRDYCFACSSFFLSDNQPAREPRHRMVLQRLCLMEEVVRSPASLFCRQNAADLTAQSGISQQEIVTLCARLEVGYSPLIFRSCSKVSSVHRACNQQPSTSVKIVDSSLNVKMSTRASDTCKCAKILHVEQLPRLLAFQLSDWVGRYRVLANVETFPQRRRSLYPK